MFEFFALLGWIVPVTFTYLFFTRLLGLGLKVTIISKVGAKTSIVTAIIAFLIPLSVWFVSVVLVPTTIYIIFGLINPIIEDMAIFGVLIIINSLICFVPPIKGSAVVFTKDLKSTMAVLALLIVFSFFSFWAFSFDYVRYDFIWFFALVAGFAVALTTFLILLAWFRTKEESIEEYLTNIFQTFGLSGVGRNRIFAAIIHFFENKKRGDSIAIENIYEMLSIEEGKTSDAIESSMRTALKTAWDKAGRDGKSIEKLYDGPIDPNRGYPSVKGFVEHFVEKLRQLS